MSLGPLHSILRFIGGRWRRGKKQRVVAGLFEGNQTSNAAPKVSNKNSLGSDFAALINAMPHGGEGHIHNTVGNALVCNEVEKDDRGRQTLNKNWLVSTHGQFPSVGRQTVARALIAVESERP